MIFMYIRVSIIKLFCYLIYQLFLIATFSTIFFVFKKQVWC